jgi:hypothetical protein
MYSKMASAGIEKAPYSNNLSAVVGFEYFLSQKDSVVGVGSSRALTVAKALSSVCHYLETQLNAGLSEAGSSNELGRRVAAHVKGERLTDSYLKDSFASSATLDGYI